jgi:hypothetical protein
MVQGCEELYARTKKLFVQQAQKRYEKHANKTQKHVEFEIEQHLWLNIQDFKMFDGLTLLFTTKYAGRYEILHEPHPDVHTLKLFINFVAHSTFHISKLKLFLHDEHRPNQKRRCK